MKFALAVLALFFTTYSAVALDLSTTKPSVNVTTQIQTFELRPISTLIEFVSKYSGKLSKVKTDAIKTFCDKVNTDQHRIDKKIPLCHDIYFAEFTDGSAILVQVTESGDAIMFTKILLNKDTLPEVRLRLKELFDNMEIVPTGTSI
jgi:hypothetical protein